MICKIRNTYFSCIIGLLVLVGGFPLLSQESSSLLLANTSKKVKSNTQKQNIYGVNRYPLVNGKPKFVVGINDSVDLVPFYTNPEPKNKDLRMVKSSKID